MFAELQWSGNLWPLLVIIPVAVLLWWIGAQFDEARIKEYGRRRGWRFELIEPRRADHDSVLDRGERYYRILYVDGRGRRRAADCKTGLLKGVFLATERDLGPAPAMPSGPILPEADCPRCGATLSGREPQCSNCGATR